MKYFQAALFICLSGICFLAGYPAYGSSSRSDNEQMELYLKKLQNNILEEEKAVESLKKKYEDILRKKQEPNKERSREKEIKNPEVPQGVMAAADVKLGDSEPTRYSLKQKNQELLNSLEQSIASIQKKNKTIEVLRKAQSKPSKKEAIDCKAKREVDCSKKEAATRRKLDKPKKVKSASERQLKVSNKEHENQLTREIIPPRPVEKVSKKHNKEINKKNKLSEKKNNSKELKKDRIHCFAASRENKPGALKGFIIKAKKLDSWWREKVW